MADKQHTPGPWRAGRMDMVSYPCDGRRTGPVKAVYVDDPNGKIHMGERLPAVVAEAYDALGCDCRANALLIAAAPDLLALVLEAADCIENCARGPWAKGLVLRIRERARDVTGT